MFSSFTNPKILKISQEIEFELNAYKPCNVIFLPLLGDLAQFITLFGNNCICKEANFRK